MSDNPSIDIERRIPTRKEAAIFRVKTALLQSRRFVQDSALQRVKTFRPGTALMDSEVIARSATPLWTETDPRERELLAGKIQNLRIAIKRLNGIEVGANEIFSFWKQVRRTTRRRGFVEGRELREGCIIPNIGGGLCQISNGLYDAALQAGFEIVERHRHTQTIPGSLAESGRDATVFWNYVDLRFRSPAPFRIEARLDSDNLIVTLRGSKIDVPKLHQITSRFSSAEPNSCATCEVGDCHRVIKPAANAASFGRTAWLVDEFVPEFAEHISNERIPTDQLYLPIDGKRFGRENYAWPTEGFASIRQSLYLTALRSYRSRKLAAQGAARQKNLLAMYEALAENYARRLDFDVLHVNIQQNFLPFLWMIGALGGRTFDVLMTALPMAELQTRLDHAAELHPKSTTLGDFRADSRLVNAETEALSAARHIITPHSEIADLFGDRAILLDWKIPETTVTPRPSEGTPVIVFPASTVGRKGCYELRDAVRGLDVKLITLGPYIESAEFWDGFDVSRGDPHWLEKANLVVLPAFVEHRPRRLLQAVAANVPVIASQACGVSHETGVTTIDAGDVAALRKAILHHISQ